MLLWYFNIEIIVIFSIVSFNYYSLHYSQYINNANLIKLQYLMIILLYSLIRAKSIFILKQNEYLRKNQ